jgi:hypothetical protein
MRVTCLTIYIQALQMIRCKMEVFVLEWMWVSHTLLHSLQQIYFNQCYMKMKQNQKIAQKWLV